MRALAGLLLLSVAACGEAEETPAAPGPTITPEPIGYPDIEANGLFGASCAYASGTSIAPLVIAFADEAVMKIDGRIQRFQVDAESEGGEIGTRTRYLAEGRTLLLSIDGRSDRAGIETGNLTGTVRLLDDAGTELFATEGGVQCGS
jgi:hypothetical protein